MYVCMCMYVCMYVCVYVCPYHNLNLETEPSVYDDTYDVEEAGKMKPWVRVYVCVYVYLYVCMYALMTT